MNYIDLANQIQFYTQNTEQLFVAEIPTFVRQAEERIYNSVQIPALRKNVTGSTAGGNKYLSCPVDFLSVFSIAVVDGSGNYEYLLNKDVNFLRASYPNPNTSGLPKYYALFGPATTSATPPSITNELTFILAPTPDNSYTVELHYYYYPESIVQGAINTLGAITGGSGYTNGVYYNIQLTGGSGYGALATIVVSGGAIISIDVTTPGALYTTSDTLSASTADIGGGTNFSVPVSGISNPTGMSWLGDNYSPVLLYGALVESYIFLKGEADMMGYYEKKYQDALGQLNRLGSGLERGDAYRDGQYKMKVGP